MVVMTDPFMFALAAFILTIVAPALVIAAVDAWIGRRR